MEVCCLKMASRCRPLRSTKDVTQLSAAESLHDCGALSRVVMVRKTDQRVINHRGNQKDPLCEVVTMETIQTYKGHKPDRTVVFKEKFDLSGNKLGPSLSAGKLTVSSPRLSISPLRTVFADSAGTSDRNNNTTTLTTKPSPNSKNVKMEVKQGSKFITKVSGPLVAPTATQSPNSLDRSNNNSVKSLVTMKIPSSANLRSYGTQSSMPRSASVYTAFERECLKAHNEYRTRHAVVPLKLSKRLCRYADEWAKVIAARGVLVHRSNSQYGENIFCSWSSPSTVSVNISGQEPVENWYSEIDSHVFGKEPATLKTGHFTQVIWKDSRELGIGVASNRSGQIFVVANYDPPGNYIGSFAKNVPPVGGFVDSNTMINKSSALKINSYTVTHTTVSAINQTNSHMLMPRPSGANSRELCATTEKHVRIVEENDQDQFDEFALAILKHHNEFRRKHGAPDLTLNKELVRDAQQWAEKLAREDRFTYRQKSKFGENLYCLWSSDRHARPNAKDVCRSWYEEIKQYTFNVEPRTAVKGGQFTQMVWKDTKELGVGIGQTRNGKVIVVCTYFPRGNVLGLFLSNVEKAH